MDRLKKARQEINKIDEEMASLFEQRMQAVDDVIKYKELHNMEILDASREQEVIEKNVAYIKNDAYRKYYTNFIEDVMAVSRSYQKAYINRDKIAYAGTLGAFSHIATMNLFPDCEHLAYPTFDSVVQAVENGDVTYGVLPFENSYTGEVGEIMDYFLEHDIYIHKMHDLKISQNLLGLKGSTVKDIRSVYSKDQAIAQSQKFLECRDWELIPYPNTALAAEYIAKCNDKSKAAIASKETAKIYDLDILCEDINTSSDNTTRFVVISKEPSEEGNRMSLVFTVQHKTGALAQVIFLLSERGLNMESIHSRSLKNKPFAYYFYVEVIASPISAKLYDLTLNMLNHCESAKIVGSYFTERKDEEYEFR